MKPLRDFVKNLIDAAKANAVTWILSSVAAILASILVGAQYERLLYALSSPVPGYVMPLTVGVMGGAVAVALWVERRRARAGLRIFVREARLSPGTSGDRPISFLALRLEATNATSSAIRIMEAELRYGLLGRRRAETVLVAMAGTRRGMHSGDTYIEPGATGSVIADFVVSRVTPGRTIRATAVLIDQLGTPSFVRHIRFRDLEKPPAKPRPVEEPLYALADPVDKQVAAVLKAEASRYQQCGRRTGGLGSIVTVTANQERLTGLGAEWRTGDSPHNQAFAVQGGELRSDNVDALTTLYNTLATEEERGRFRSALTKRLACDTEYTPIAYLPLVCSFRLGFLRDVLDAAKRQLRGDKTLGFDELLRVLDGLLRFEHARFDERSFDDIERFIEGLDCHLYEIRQRLAAIRAHRLTATGGQQLHAGHLRTDTSTGSTSKP